MNGFGWWCLAMFNTGLFVSLALSLATIAEKC